MSLTPEQIEAWKPKFNKAVIIISRRIITILSNILPVLFNPQKNQELIAEQNAAIGQTDFSDAFVTLESTFEYISPVLFTIFKCQVLREAIAKYAPVTQNDPNRPPITLVLLLQDDTLPRLIAFGSHGSCINSVFDSLNIKHQDKTIEIIPFEYISLHYVIILKPKTFREIYIKYEDLLVDNEPLLYRMIMDFLKIAVKILSFTHSPLVDLPIGTCTHGCSSSQQSNVETQPYHDPQENLQAEASANQPHSVTTVYMTFQERSTVYSYREIIDIMRSTRNVRYPRYYQ